MATKTRDSQTICHRRAEQKEVFAKIFENMHQYYEKSSERQGIEVTIQLLLEAALLEFEETGKVVDSSSVLFQMFCKINYLKMEFKDVQFYIRLLNKMLQRMSREHTSLKVNGEAFHNEFAKYIILLEDTYLALQHFKQSKIKSNKFLRVLYGCKVIELLSKARLYNEIKKFSKNEYAPILERDFEW